MTKFLIVDDDPACRRLLKQFLSPLGHCNTVFDGREAIAAVRIALENDEPYDLICLDVMMPGLDGHETLDAIRRLEQESGRHGFDGARVIMTTALMESEHCIRAFREGCECYLTKPLSQEDLLKQVHALLGEVHAKPSRPDASAAAPSTSPACAAAVPPPLPPAPQPAPARSARTRGRFLIVDDDRVCRELLKDFLSPYADCDLAYDGAEAVDAVRLAIEDGDPYDLICLDIMMPRMTGHEVLRMVRQIEEQHGIAGSAGVKVIMTTALRESKHCVQAFREGCESYATKPIHEADLLEKMREVGILPSESQL